MASSYVFRSISELAKVLSSPGSVTLLDDMYNHREYFNYNKSRAFRVLGNKPEVLHLLLKWGIIQEMDDCIYIDETFVRFFEDIFRHNDEINTDSISEYKKELENNIRLYERATTDLRKSRYLGKIRKLIYRIPQRLIRNVVSLELKTDDSFICAASFKEKLLELEILDEKRKYIQDLIKEIKFIIESNHLFFREIGDISITKGIDNINTTFIDTNYALLRIDREIIKFINYVKEQDRLIQKIKKLQNLRDSGTWRAETNVTSVVNLADFQRIGVRDIQKNSLIDLDILQDNNELYSIIKRISEKKKLKSKRTTAGAIPNEFLEDTEISMNYIDIREMWSSFKAQGEDLFSFVRKYRYDFPRDIKDHLNLFYRMASVYVDKLKFTEEYKIFENIKYAVIYG